MSDDVYIVLHEWGQCDDWCMTVGGVFATLDAARGYIAAQAVEFCRTPEGELVEEYMRDIEEAGAPERIAPTEHPAPLSPRSRVQVGGAWYIDGDPRYDADLYRIERWEVRR